MAEASSTGATVPSEDDEQEYESDPDEALLPSAMRRREASDDEEGVGASDGEEEINRAGRRIGRIASEEDSDGQGGAPGYEDDEDSEREDYVEEGAEEDYEELVGEEAGAVYGDPGDQNHVGSAGRAEISPEAHNFDGDKEDCRENAQGESEEKKENEPFAVPTAGAFYMHDDRFRNSRGGRHGRMKGGGRRLWESKDEKQWVHDRFEEMSFQDSRHKERNPRGRFRGRSGIRNSDRVRGYTRGNKPQSYEERPHGYDDRSRAFTDDQSRSYADGDHQNHASKSVRGRGNRRYEPLPKSNSEHPTTQTKQSGRSNDGGSANTMTRKTSGSSNVHAEQSHQQKHIFNSSLNSASPPFYPSGSSSNQDIPASSKRDPQAPNTNQNLSAFGDDSLRGKPIVQDRYSVDESGQSVSLKNIRNLQRTQGRGFTPSTQQAAPVSQLGQRTSQTSAQSLQRASNQALSTNLSEVGESDSPRGSVKSVSTVSGKSKVITQGSGRGSFMYGGAQVMGAGGSIGLAQGDPNFPGTPALLPVMQFGGQHPGVPTVGMALPGYVAQPQMGFGNSEMTWVPVLAGSAGGMGGSYAPYFALDGSYYACPPGQTSSGVSSSSSSSRDSAPPKTVHPLKNPQRLEISNDEFGQRQNKPRRYSEMNFGQ